MTSVTFTLATPLPTNKSVPTGGVQSPIQRFITMMIPKCTGSIPNSVTRGKNIGVKINSAGVISMNVPITNKVRLIIRKTMIGLLTLLSNTLDRYSGKLSNENSHDIAMEVPIRKVTIALVFALCKNIVLKSFQRTSLYARAKTAAYTTAIADPSVAVKTRTTMPPTTTTSINKLKKASLKLLQTSEKGTRSPRGKSYRRE